MRAGRVAAVLSMLPLACSLTTDSDGLTPGSVDLEAGTDATTEAAADAGTPAPDALALDAPGDRGEDAGPGAPGCKASTAIFCADFDQGIVTSLWDSADVLGGGTLLLDSATFRSPLQSASARTPTIDGTSVPKAKARLVKSFSATATSVRVGFDVRVDSVSPNNARGELLALSFFSGAGSYTLYLIARSNGDVLNEYAVLDAGSQGNDHPLSTQLARSGWQRVELNANLVTARGRVTIDGQTSALDTSLSPPFASGTTRLYLGLVVDQAASEFDVHYDNVTYDAP
jgi:hypothetical protein